MTVQELHDLYTKKTTLYNESLTRATVAQENIEKKLQEVDSYFINKLVTENKIDLTFINTLDLERLKTDTEYLHTMQVKLETGINQLKRFIEESLNV